MATKGTAFITGASSGIGAEFAHQLAADGYSLVLHGRRNEKLRQLSEDLGAKYEIDIRIVIAEMTDYAGLQELERAIDDTTDLQLLVNNAGYGDPGLFQERSIESMTDMIRVHNEAVVRLTHRAVPIMLEAGSGGIINVSSVAAWLPGRGSAMYYATKAFLNSFSRALASDLRDTGISVQALCPGFTHTEFHARERLSRFDKSSTPSWLWMDAKDVVRLSLASLGRGRTIIIPGWRNRLFAWIGGHDWLYHWITRKR